MRLFEEAEPFGKPDGSADDIGDNVVSFAPRYGGIARDPADMRVRVVVGQLGSGKSLHLRRMQDSLAKSDALKSQVAAEVETSSELSTRSLRKFAEEMGLVGGNTEDWKLLWRRSIIRSACTHLLCSSKYSGLHNQHAWTALKNHSRFLGSPETEHKVTQEAESILGDWNNGDQYRKYLTDKRWADIDNYVATLLRESAGLNLYIDDVDKNFRWAPSLWLQCQRGLFYAVMDLLREDRFRSKLHATVALRDIAFSSVKQSEQASRYVDGTHIAILAWNKSSMRELLTAKLRTLPHEYFTNPGDRTIDSWLGRSEIVNTRPQSTSEDLIDYLLRHTNMVPRDLIRLGNVLCNEIKGLGGEKPDEQTIREIVSKCSGEFASRQVAQAANQVLSDIIPQDAYRHGYEHVYLEPNGYQLQDARNSVLECIALTQQDIFGVDALERIDAHATELFYSDVHVRLSDIMWQQSLLGYVDPAGKGHFCNVESFDGNSLIVPRHQQVKSYIWNPIVFDLGTGLTPTLMAPIWPG